MQEYVVKVPVLVEYQYRIYTDSPSTEAELAEFVQDHFSWPRRFNGMVEEIPTHEEGPEWLGISTQEAWRTESCGFIHEWVGIYLVDRCCGGHEEGGWWYDGGHLQEQCQVHTPEQLEMMLTDYRRKCEEWNIGRRPISSVLSTGIYEVTRSAHYHYDRPKDTKLPEYYPERRPHYE